MEKALTRGLKTRRSIPRRRCGKVVMVHSEVTGTSIKVCETDLLKIEDQSVSGLTGRPKGTTVAKGARPPRFATCRAARWIDTKRGHKVCKCTEPHGQIVKSKFCRR